jgi:hypothetical protein
MLQDMLEENWVTIAQEYVAAAAADLVPGTGYTDIRQGGLMMQHVKTGASTLSIHPHGIHRGGLWSVLGGCCGSAVSGQRSAVSGQRSAVSDQRSAVGG